MTQEELEEEIRQRLNTEGGFNPSPEKEKCNWCGSDIPENWVVHCVQKHGEEGFEVVFYCSPECLSNFKEELMPGT